MPTDDPSPSYTEVFELLASERRRELLRLLRTYDDPIPVEELAAILACGDRDQRDHNVRHRVAAELRHKQLPMLADHDVVEYDAGTVGYRSHEFVETLLELTADEETVALGEP